MTKWFVGALDPAAEGSGDTDRSRTRLPREAVKSPQGVLPACPKDHSNQTPLCQKHCPAPELRGLTAWGSVHSHHQTKFTLTLDHWPQSTPLHTSSFHMKSWSTPWVTGELQIKITATCFIQKNHLRRIKPIHLSISSFLPGLNIISTRHNSAILFTACFVYSVSAFTWWNLNFCLIRSLLQVQHLAHKRLHEYLLNEYIH